MYLFYKSYCVDTLPYWTSNISEKQIWNNCINYWHKYIEANNKNDNGSEVEDNAEYIDIV